MKYAELVYGRNSKQLSKMQYANLGDYFQTFAMINLYKQLNILEKDIQIIDRGKLYNYQGEELLLPMQGWFGYIKGIEIFPLSPKIKPVFLGYHCIEKRNYSKKMLQYYQKHVPIGCRDEATYLIMKKYGINAYLTGCLTITLPERDTVPKTTHVFLVDAPNDIERYMPKELTKNISYITQEICLRDNCSNESETERIMQLSAKLLERYKNEATLIVTSRLHCAGPCLGMGIPVILARNYFDSRYSWIDKYLPLYTPDKFKDIDWYPKKVDLSEIKPQLLKMAEKMILDLPDKEESMGNIHRFYMNRRKEKTEMPFYTKAYLSMRTIFPKTADFLREVVLKKYTVATAREKSDI